jgi:hypothetical protein
MRPRAEMPAAARDDIEGGVRAGNFPLSLRTSRMVVASAVYRTLYGAPTSEARPQRSRQV